MMRHTCAVALLVFVSSLTACITTSSNGRQLEKGEHEVAVALGAGALLHIPYVSPEITYKYGLTDKLNLRLQAFDSELFGFGGTVGVSPLLCAQQGALPQLSLYFEIGGGGYFVPENTGTFFSWPTYAGRFITHRVSSTISYTNSDFMSGYFGAAYSSYIEFVSISSNARQLRNSAMRVEAFGAFEFRPTKLISFQLEAKAGVSFGLLSEHQLLDAIIPFVAIYPGIKFRF